MNTKDQILIEARKVFERFGFNKTSMADIAAAARKGRRTVYTYFTSKEEVFRAVIDVEVKALAVRLKEIIEGDQTPKEKLRHYMHTRMNAVKELTIYYDALRQDLLGNFGMIENLRRDYDEMEVNMIQKILDEGVERNEFSIDTTHLVASAIVLATKGFELPLYMGNINYDHEQLIDPLINLFYTGILKS
jgi:AcrR family transcriptional regulator